MLPLDGQMQGRLQVDVLQIELRPAGADEELGNFDVIVERGQVKGCVSVIFLLIDDPRARKLGQQHAHGTAEREKEEKKSTNENKTR